MTGRLMRKDLELGLEVGRQLNVPLPVTALTHQIVVSLIGQGLGDLDFGALLELEARSANFELVPDDRPVSDGL
jgi:3-hydroxyisobutyrate dehydrogenase